MMRFRPEVKMPWLIQFLYPKALCRIKTSEKVVYLTFDDGPIPEVTPWVLSLLKKEQIKASFFCVGENVQKYPGVFKQIIAEGHTVGNHTFNHVQGLKTGLTEYLGNIKKANKLIGSTLFRPPHGFLKKAQYRKLKNSYQFVLWDIVSRDFDKRISATDVYKNVMNYVQAGSIIIFHDSLKAERNMKEALPKVIHSLKEQGYIFRTIPERRNN